MGIYSTKFSKYTWPQWSNYADCFPAENLQLFGGFGLPLHRKSLMSSKTVLTATSFNLIALSPIHQVSPQMLHTSGLKNTEARTVFNS